MKTYYNEIDKFAAQWLRNLIAAGEIAPGTVDERDVQEVRPEDLEGFTRCHFFAGIAGWDLALQLAGWPEDREVYTFSLPCQPFSAAGKRGKFKDERHLWPVMFELIKARMPQICFGEQVASRDGLEWYDHVKKDMNSIGYTMICIDLPAAMVGAPHIRQRLWFAGVRNSAIKSFGNGNGLGEGTSHEGSCQAQREDGGQSAV